MEIFADIRQFFRISLVEFRMSLSSEFAYRWQVLMWVLSDAVQPVIFATLWSVVATSGNRDFTSEQIISYYFLVAIIGRLTQDWSIQFISDSIIRGEFSKYLIRPFNYLSEMFGISMAIRTMRVFLLAPFLVVAYILFNDRIIYQISSTSTFLFIGALFLGYFINFMLGNIFALSAFFVKQIYGLRALYVNLVSILSGEYIPLSVLAVGMFFLFEILPFRYILSFPIEIFMGVLSSEQIERGFQLGVFWLIVLIIIYQLMYRKGIQKYESEGI